MMEAYLIKVPWNKQAIASEYILRKYAKGSGAFEQFQIVFDSLNMDEVFGIVCCCV